MTCFRINNDNQENEMKTNFNVLLPHSHMFMELKPLKGD